MWGVVKPGTAAEPSWSFIENIAFMVFLGIYTKYQFLHSFLLNSRYYLGAVECQAKILGQR